ncbi:MAG TPA: DUF4388 domain-containing protein [Polyangia bacterium]|nr:DUF4388 domain-containing protein [Polyangia bacterium]
MQPPVVIAANPYEGELCRRALADTGLEVQLAEDRGHARELVQSARPLVVVIAAGWYHADALELIPELRELARDVPIFLLGDRDGAINDENAAAKVGANRLFLRPIEVDALADAIEKLAVEDELHGEVSAQLEAVSHAPPPGEPAVELEADYGAEWEVHPATPVARAPTEVLPPATTAVEIPSALGALPAPPPTVTVPSKLPLSDTDPGRLLRADDVLAEAAGLRIQALASADFAVRSENGDPPAPRAPAGAHAEHFADRSTFARRLDRQLSEVERRLFPDSTPQHARGGYDYDDALGDIDLDSLGIDTLPGIAADSLDQTFDRRERERANESDTNANAAVNATSSSLLRLASERSAGESELATPPTLEEEGELSSVDIAELLAGLHASGWSGRLSLARGDGEKAIWFDAGLPVFATSTFQHDRLGDLLFREGKITREQHARTRELAVEPGRRTAAVLVELGMLKPRELFTALRRHAEEIVYSCFAWDSGHFRLAAADAPAEDKLRLSFHPWALILEGVRRKYGLERLVERVGATDTVLTPTTGMERALEDCELTPPERVVAEMFDGERSLADVALATSGLPGATLTETGLYALAWGLCAVGAARIGAQGVDRVGVRAASTLVTPVGAQSVRERRAGKRDGEAAERPADRAVDRERLLAKRAQVADADYFAILGVDRHASTHEIERAFERLRTDFAPERFAEPVRAELHDALDEIREVLDEAHRVLADEAVRHAYREHLIE